MAFVVTGASSGLGKEIAHWLNEKGYDVVNWSLDTNVDLRMPYVVDQAGIKVKNVHGKIDGLVNCAGINYINWFEDIPVSEWDNVMNTNVRGMFLATRALLPVLQDGVVCNIISNASHMPMTHSAVYNASKGAAHILTLQMARELKATKNITVFGVSPNKLAGTKMSTEIESRVCELRGWTPEFAKEYQLKALPAGQETDPETCGHFIANILSNREYWQFLNGCVLPFGA